MESNKRNDGKTRRESCVIRVIREIRGEILRVIREIRVGFLRVIREIRVETSCS
mgnify:CR=1 FL=1